MSRIAGLDLVVVDNPGIGPHASIQAAINSASPGIGNPAAAVWVPASYTGGEAVPNSPAVPVWDLRGTGSQSFGGITFASSLPATCTPGVTQPVQISGSISVGVPSFTYGAGTVFYCAATNQWSPVSQGSGAGPILGWYLGPQCPQSNAGQCFYTPADVQVANDCSWTNASTTVTCNSAHFVAADVGKSVMGGRTCANDQTSTISDAGQISTTTLLTIQSVTDSQHVVLSGLPANTQALVTTFPIGGCFIWGHLDDAGASAIDTAMQSAAQCPKLFLAAANYFFASPHFFTNPSACAAIGPGLGSPSFNFGNTVLSAGFEIEGRGRGNTAWYLTPTFPNGDACTHVVAAGAPNPAHTGACFIIPVMGAWRDFRIDGGAQGNTPNLNTKTLLWMAVATLERFSCLNYGGFTGGNSVGIEMSYQGFLNDVDNSGCGAIAFWQDSGTNQSNGYRVVAENSSFHALNIAGPTPAGSFSAVPSFTCYWCWFSLAADQIFGVSSVIQNAGGILQLYGGLSQPMNGPTFGLNNGNWDYQATVSGSLLYADGHQFLSFAPGSGNLNTNGAISCTAACTNRFINSVLQSQSSSFDIQDVVGSKHYDLGGNIVTPRMSISGQVFGSPSVTGTALAASNITPTTGFGTGCATAGQCMSAVSGSSGRGQFTVTYGTSPASPQTLTVTFPTTFWTAPFCTLVDVGGTNAFPTSITTTSTSTTTAVFSIVNTPVGGNTDILQLSCSAP